MNCDQDLVLSAFDKTLLNLIQTDFPLAERPFAVLAERLGVAEAVVIVRLAELKGAGYIRRLGPFFDVAKLGYRSTLVAAQVEQTAIEQVARVIDDLPGVTHNYEREGDFNLWFTLMSRNEEQEAVTLAEVARLPGVRQVMNLPAGRRFKVDVRFRLK